MRMSRLALVAAAIAVCAAPTGAQTSTASTAATAQDAYERAQDAQKKAQDKAKAAEKAKHAEGWKDEGGEEFTERIERTFKAGDAPMLALLNIAGKINVTAGGPDIRIEATKRVRAKSEADAKRQLEGIRIDMAEHAGRVEARAMYTYGKNRAWVEYVVTAPKATTLELRSVSGDLAIDGIKGEVSAETVAGNVWATGLAGEASLKAVSGDVKVVSSAVDGEINASSVSGNVYVKALKARSISAGTVSGNVLLHGAVSERSLVRSVHGNVELAGALVRNGRYELKSHAGNIKLTVDGKTGFEVEASSFSGRIKTELPLTVQSQSENEGHGPPNRNLRAVFGDGSARVEISTFSGVIYIGMKTP